MAKTEDDIVQGDLQGIPRDKLLEMLRWMVLSRRFEEKAAEAYQTGKIGGFCHLYIGQEAVARTAREVIAAADAASDEPTADLLTQRMQIHEKNAWMLRSMLA